MEMHRKNINIGGGSCLNPNAIYFPLCCALGIVFTGATVYYSHRYGDISDNSDLNKYKLSEKNILIRLKLFKYNNNFNYLLLIPYLIAWNLVFALLILYIIYWCGVVGLESFFTSIYLDTTLVGVFFLLWCYSLFMDIKIPNHNHSEAPDFVMKSEEKENKKDE